MGLLNLEKVKQLGSNAVIPFIGTGIVFSLAFGFSWWTIPISLVISSFTSLLISTPKNLALGPSKKENLSLSEPKQEFNKNSWF